MNKTKNVSRLSTSRIFSLIKLQIGDKLRKTRHSNKGKFALSILFRVVFISAITLAIYFLLGLIKDTFYLNLDRITFTSIIFMWQVFDILSVAINSTNKMFSQKDNAMLLILPCKFSEIFISKIITLLISGIYKSLFVLFPFMIAYGIVIKVSVSYYIWLLPCFILLEIFSVFIGTAFSVILTKIKRFLKSHIILHAILLILCLVLVFVCVYKLLNLIPLPIRIIAVYNQFITSVYAFLQSLSNYTLFYSFIGNLMFAEKVILNILLLILSAIIIIVLCGFMVVPFFFKTASDNVESSSSKKHNIRIPKSKNLFATFIRKEFKMLFRSSENLNNAIAVILIFPILIYVLNFIIAGIQTSRLGDYLTISFNVMIITSLLSIFNSSAASSISSEGEGFSLLKIAPSNTTPVCYAKILVIGVVNLLAVLASSIMIFYTCRLSILDVIFMIITICIVSLGNIMWNFELDVINPKINEYAVKGESYIDNPNVSKAIFNGFLVSMFSGIITLLLLFDAYVSGWIRILLIATAFLAVRIYLLNSNLKAYFNDIQM